MAKMCRSCSKAEMKTGTETYRYQESGLPNVVLVGIEVRRCPECGLVLPRVAELHRAIALSVIHKPSRFSGLEVRYLRKYLGWSGADFARHIGVDPSTVSNWENDKEPIGTVSDRSLRMMVAIGAQVVNYSLDELTKIDGERTPPVEVRLSPKARGWEVRAA
jgi:YgiT-type zinc finger domain-containing protein